jgi:hypothetical protein
MNIEAILRESWRITWKHRQLWMLGLLMYVVSFPPVLVAGGIGGAAGALSATFPGRPPALLRQLRQVEGSTWVAITVAALIVLVLTVCIAWVLQTVSFRGAALAADRGGFSLRDAFSLGRQRLVSILTVTVLLSMVSSTLGLLPPLVFLASEQRGPSGMAIMRSLQLVLTPVGVVIGQVLMIVTLAIALEGLRPAAALRRGWQVFRAGWWVFLFALGLLFFMGLVVGVIAVAVLFPLSFIVAALVIATSPDILWTVLVAGVPCVLVIFGPLALFISVFTTTLYTLTYREAAKRVTVTG